MINTTITLLNQNKFNPSSNLKRQVGFRGAAINAGLKNDLLQQIYNLEKKLEMVNMRLSRAQLDNDIPDIVQTKHKISLIEIHLEFLKRKLADIEMPITVATIPITDKFGVN